MDYYVLRKTKIVILFILLFILSASEAICLNSKIMDLLYPKISTDNNRNLIVVSIDIESCQSCISLKVNSMINNLKDNIDESNTVLICETKIEKDCYAIADRYKVDFFIEDTNSVFSSLGISFPSILFIDKNKDIMKFNFNDLLNSNSELVKLINSENYKINKRKNINEIDPIYISDVLKPVIKKNELYFLSEKSNKFFKYDFEKAEMDIQFQPSKEELIIHSDIPVNLIDSLEIYNYLDINFLYNLNSFDYRNDRITILVNKLSEIEYKRENDHSTFRMILSDGLLEFNEEGTRFNEFKTLNIALYDDFVRNNNHLFLKFKYSDNPIIDSLALVINVDEKYEFDTLISVRDLSLSEDEYTLKMNDLVDIIRAGEEDLFLYSQKLGRIYKFSEGKISSFNLGGIHKIYDGFAIRDMIVHGKKVYTISVSDNSRMLIQSYSSEGHFLSEEIYLLDEDELLSTSFVKNEEAELILLNKWRNKRWTLDYLNYGIPE